jgi:hypothetical protein
MENDLAVMFEPLARMTFESREAELSTKPLSLSSTLGVPSFISVMFERETENRAKRGVGVLAFILHSREGRMEEANQG